MNKYNYWIAFFWIVLIAFGSCARRGAPTGGIKDTIPPVLVRATPENETTNFDGDEIELVFNEYIQARGLKKELIITPPIEEYDFYTNKQRLYIKLEEDLQDSTTYTFNFGEALQDLSEGNAADNIVLAFSTGSYIDSFQVAGNVKALLTQQPVENAIVALYNTRDTLDAFTGPPVYFAKTDEEGNYIIRYIKEGLYNIYAYVDENSNLKIESNKEPFGFKAEPIYLGFDVNKTLQDSIDSVSRNVQAVDLTISREDVRPIKLQSNRNNGKYYEFRFNKGLENYTLSTTTEDIKPATRQLLDTLNVNTIDTTRYLYSNFQDDHTIIRVYNTLQQDSLRTVLSVQDSVGQAIQDTVVYIQFAETKRDPAEFETKFATDEPAIDQTIEATVAFSKPVIHLNSDSILLSYDTLFYLPIDYAEAFTWNKRLDEVTIQIPVDKGKVVDSLLVYQRINDSTRAVQKQQQERLYLDSLRSASEAEQQKRFFKTLANIKRTPAVNTLLDSIQPINSEDSIRRIIAGYIDTASVEPLPEAKSYSREEAQENLKSLNFYLAGGSFMSVEGDSSEQVLQKYSFKKPENYGTISGTVDTEYEHYFLQLLNEQYEVVRELKDPTQYRFTFVPPGTYRLRMLVDENNNGVWDRGNILQKHEPEPVYVFENEIPVRENWEFGETNISTNALSTASSE